MDKNKEFYFLEMNTACKLSIQLPRLVTGLDLVELMIKVALGEKLPFKQKILN